MLIKCCSYLHNSRSIKLFELLQISNISKYGSRTTSRNIHNFRTDILNYTNSSILRNTACKKSVIGFAFVRHASTGEIPTVTIPTTAEVQIPKIPDPPTVPDIPITPDITEIASGVEPAITTLGLGGWTPVGIVQNCLEYLHIGCDLPWWGSIIVGTIVVRTLLFPLVILAQRNGAKMNNNLPQMQVLQLKMTEARQSGNAMEAARYSQEMMLFMKEKGVNPLKNMLVPLAQAPLFVSFFIGLRQMANAPIESMRHGGLFWFTDLTMPDQYFLLPLLTSATLSLTIEIGTDSAKLNAQNMQTMKYVLRALPVIVFPFTINFPGAILCYWTCSNFISLIQVGVLKIPAVRDYFKIERAIDHNPNSLPIPKKPFIQGMKDSWTNMKITRELQERERIDEIRFQRAGAAALIKTYKHDPTKVPVEPKKKLL